MHPDTGYSNFLQIHEKYGRGNIDLNEADTRAKTVDFILRDALGWPEGNISREDHVETGYTDYQLIYENICLFVIEAKKIGHHFEIPKTMTNRTYKIEGSISAVTNLTEAMNQARSYCIELGVKYAAICNGYQFVIFSAITIGKNWKKGHCVVFNSLDDIRENFNLFWNMLAFEHVIHGSLVTHLEKGKRDILFKKVLSEMHNADQTWARNDLYTYIRPLSSFIFSELLDEARTEVLKQCYIFDKTNRPLSEEMQDFFSDQMPFFGKKYNVKDIFERESKAGVFGKEVLKNLSNQKKGSLKGSLIVLLGGVGSGKSTFLHRFFKIVLSEYETLLWFYVDFRTSPINEGETETFILSRVLESWQSRYQPKLKDILDEIGFSSEPNGDKSYFTILFALLHRLGFSLALIIDNVDQHDYKLQEKIFLTSYHLTDVLKTVTIVALREETFLSSTRSGVFDAYDTPKFHIASPNFLDLILKRIEFTISYGIPNLLANLAPTIKNDLKKYFRIIGTSLQGANKQSNKIISFMNTISVGNMREALRMFNSFIVSGNTNTREIFEKYEHSGRFQVAYHQLVKSIILGEYRYYSQTRSHLMNVFDFDSSLTDSHYHPLRILNYLNARINVRSPIATGYVLIEELLHVGEQVFIDRKVILDSLLRLSNFNLVEYENQSRTDINSAAYVKITPAGHYYLNNLIYEFVYLDSVLVDTPIADFLVVERLKTLSAQEDLQARLSRTKIFVEYLSKSEIEELKEHPEYMQQEFTNNIYGVYIAERYYAIYKELNEKFNFSL
jgi:GTPase SAR1 family protein